MNPFSRNAVDRQTADGSAHFQLSKDAIYRPQAGGTSQFLHRMVVLDVIIDPTVLTDVQIDKYEHELGVSNIKFARALPRNTIIGQRVLDGSASASEPPLFLFPLLPSHLALPCKPGEHVWVMFESELKQQDLGYWICRISEPHYVDDVNHTHSPRVLDPSFSPDTASQFNGATAVYEFRNGRPKDLDDQSGRYTVAESALIPGGEQAYETIIKSSSTAKLTALAPVPRIKKRPGDIVLEGSNNASMTIGTDRAGPAGVVGPDGTYTLAIGDVAGSGAIDLVAGRGQTAATSGKTVKNSLGGSELGKASSELAAHEGDPDFKTDRSRVYVAQMTHPDANFGLKDLNAAAFKTVIDSPAGDGAVVVASDKIRIISRADVEIVATGFTPDSAGLPTTKVDHKQYAAVVLKANGDIVLRPGLGGKIKFEGDDADQHAVLGDDLIAYLLKAVAAFNGHLHSGETAGPDPVISQPPAQKMPAPSASLLAKQTVIKKTKP